MKPVLDDAFLSTMGDFTSDHRMRILVSACLSGLPCGVDGSSYGEFSLVLKLIRLPNVEAFTFCPEDFSFGTPRDMPDIHGGNGFDVLDRKARVLTHKGEDWTAGMIAAAERMLKIAGKNQIHLAILQDMSAACGTQVISDGCRLVADRKYRKGPGVCAALLVRNGYRVVSERDYRSLDLLFRKLDKTHTPDPNAIDHHETSWYRQYFG